MPVAGLCLQLLSEKRFYSALQFCEALHMFMLQTVISAPLRVCLAQFHRRLHELFEIVFFFGPIGLLQTTSSPMNSLNYALT